MYRGRFAPSPTGLLHAGSLVAALASWLDARAHGGQWLVRIEDVDTPRCPPGVGEAILAQLTALGLHPDAPPLWQSTRHAAYAASLAKLTDTGWAYGCRCSRREIAAAAPHPTTRHGERPYPGTCRPVRGGAGVPYPRAWRLWSTAAPHAPGPHGIDWCDRRLGVQTQWLDEAVGDVVLRRADGLWAYQLAVVVDDADQGITHVVRGEDLADNTPRQIHLQRALGLRTPRYLHTPLVLGTNGEKLSKQNGAAPLDVREPLQALAAALETLEIVLPDRPPTLGEWLLAATRAWSARWHDAGLFTPPKDATDGHDPPQRLAD